ncbi:LysM domain protein [Planctomycetes bacterium MalM25]|nr:LysM domain protein [Planctomycetes bacterium MalM25]
MSTIRPLATIAVLAVLGVYLAQQIQKGPSVALEDDWSESGDSAIEMAEPPAWQGGDSQAAEAATSPTARSAPSWAESPSEPAPTAMPALPELPSAAEPPSAPPAVEPTPIQGQPAGTTLANEPVGAPSFPTATQEKLPLPDVIPQANYGAPAASTELPPNGVSGSVPSLGSATSRYSETPAATPIAPPTASAPGFDAAWQAAQTALQRNELPQAHRMLSKWRTEPNLTPTQRTQLESLLAQLAGTLVYSTQHFLAPPHRVEAGETLATIGEQYQVPWQLLAKINGVAKVDGVEPGQVIKVLRGPFAADVDLQRGELALMLDGVYAGKFPIRVEGATPGEGAWMVGQKRLEPDALSASPVTPKVVLQSPTGQQVELSATPTPSPGTTGRLTVASRDLSDLYDILSVGSAVTIRR